VREALSDTPAVLIHGARQSGKTTLAKHIGKTADYRYISFDDVGNLEFAESDPVGFVRSLPKRTILDEVQRVPGLFTALKLVIDEDRQPGRFLMTGSANVMLVPKLADSLAGRIEILHLHPLSQAELKGVSPQFMENAFANQFTPVRWEERNSDLADRLVAGGYPVPHAMKSTARARWYRNHARTIAERDVQDLAHIRGLDAMPRLLEYASAETSGLVNYTNLAEVLGVARRTAQEYVTLLEHVFVLDTLRPWSRNATSRMVKAAKLHIGDTGLATGLLDLDADDLKANRQLYARLAETFALQELQRLASGHARRTTFSHFRDRDGHEVDIVLERGPQRMVGVEVKTAASVTAKDFRGLRKLRDIAGDAFAAGVVLYDGAVGYSHDDNLWALPIRTLWDSDQ
jgi:predicted AAA+ superfamily ATPase